MRPDEAREPDDALPTQALCLSAWLGFCAGAFQTMGMPTSGVGDRGIWVLLACAAVGTIARRCQILRFRKGLVLSLATIAGLTPWLFLATAPSLESLEDDGNRIVASLESHRAADGVYPAELAGLDVPWSRFAWEYTAARSGSSFRLSVGSYERDGFSLTYRSERASWFRDT